VASETFAQSVLQTIVDSSSSETITFWWKTSCAQGTDYIRFYVDSTLKDSISGDTEWAQKECTIDSGIHTLEWVYDDNAGNHAENCGWVDPRIRGDKLAPAEAEVRWSGSSPAPDPANWQTSTFEYDVYGRRSEKSFNGYAAGSTCANSPLMAIFPSFMPILLAKLWLIWYNTQQNRDRIHNREFRIQEASSFAIDYCPLPIPLSRLCSPSAPLRTASVANSKMKKRSQFAQSSVCGLSFL